MMETNSPGKTSMLTPRSAGTSTLPERYTLHKFSVLSIGSNARSRASVNTSEDGNILVALAISS